MARRRRRGSTTRSQDAETFDPASDVASLSWFSPSPVRLPSPISIAIEDVFGEVQDFRQWHPDGALRPMMSTSGGVAGVGARPSSRAFFDTYPAFENPAEAVECFRRKSRREVFFAKRLKRRGGRGGGRRTWRSLIKC